MFKLMSEHKRIERCIIEEDAGCSAIYNRLEVKPKALIRIHRPGCS